MKKDKIEFSDNWNGKLINDNYTTIRLHDPKKYKAGVKYDIYLKNTFMGVRKIIDIRILTIHQINDWVARLDTGHSRQELETILKGCYKNIKNIDSQRFDLILLGRR